MRKRILVVCMVDSVHTARWLSQFTNEDIDFWIFASKKHKHIHPGLISLLMGDHQANYRLSINGRFASLHGYIDFIFNIVLAKLLRQNFRLKWFLRFTSRQSFDYIHALEIQGGGYLAKAAIERHKLPSKFIVTNWGSDIYFYQQFPEHLAEISSTLQLATHYSAECQRDYELARSLGFMGVELPCFPNAGGFEILDVASISPSAARSNIIAKAYGGTFGRGDLVIQALHNVLTLESRPKVFLYSVTDDLLESATELKSKFPDRVTFSSRRNPVTHQEMLKLFQNSRIYIGASRSDGISTSFLEALISGAYPIQTNTSCAGEWTKIGAVASIVSMNAEEMTSELINALQDDELVSRAQSENYKVAKSHLGVGTIKKQALTFYNS